MAITLRSSREISYPIRSAGAFTATLAVRETGPVDAAKPRLLDRVRQAIRTRHYSRRTEKAYVHWITGSSATSSSTASATRSRWVPPKSPRS